MTKDVITLKIWEQEYEVKFPLTNQLIELTDLRVRLSAGNYDAFKALDSDGLIVSLIVDMIAHFSVLIPTLKERLHVKGFLELPVEKVIELCWIYNDNFKPWYDEILNALSLRKGAKKESESVVSVAA